MKDIKEIIITMGKGCGKDIKTYHDALEFMGLKFTTSGDPRAAELLEAIYEMKLKQIWEETE